MSVRIDATERQHVAGLALQLVRRHAPTLEPLLRIEWNARFTSRLGDAMYLDEGAIAQTAFRTGRRSVLGWEPMARVRFSIPLWPRASRTERDETVAHEVAHLITVARWTASLSAPLRFGTLRPPARPSAHGREWQAIMREMGYVPKRCHSVDRTGLARRRKSRRTYALRCPNCDRTYMVGAQRHARAARREALVAAGACPKTTFGYLCQCDGPRAHRFLHTTRKDT